MRKTVTTVAACLFVAGLASAQMKKDATTPAPAATRPAQTGASPLVVSGAQQNGGDAVRLISREDAHKLYQQNKAIFIDVRSGEQFALGHIKGAVNIPGSQIISRFKEIMPGKVIITYCACSAEQSSARAVQQLASHGVKNTYALKGGWADWKSASFPIATGPK
jgi:rhodanese-related sulfurtransferase